MRNWTKFALYLVLATLLLACLAPGAEARRRLGLGGIGGGSSGSGSSEAIELVHDLPDTQAYVIEGGHYDLGWKYKPGAFASGMFVAYRGEQYTGLGDAELATLASALGFDPTRRHRAKVDAGAGPGTTGDVIERLPGESLDAYRARARALANRPDSVSATDPVAPSAAPMATGSAMGDMFQGLYILLPLLGIGAYALQFWLRLRAGKRRLATSRDEPPEHDLDTRSFDARVAARLREINGGGTISLAKSPTPTPAPPAAPAPRGFGRRGL